jgi:type 1 glutamine amidotransferase
VIPRRFLIPLCLLSGLVLAPSAVPDTGSKSAKLWLTLPGGDGPGKGKHVVLVSGDEEYRSEEALPQLAKILAKRHGFTCTVLFAIDPKTGTINPNVNNNIPGLEALDKADLMIIFTRFRNLPDEQMKHIAAYVESGRPIIGMRTATHAFAIPARRKYAKYDWRSKSWPGGFGQQVLGETWVDHHGQNHKESTRGLIAPGATSSPILSGIKNGDIWGPTGVYKVHVPLPKSCKVLVLGEVVQGMKPSDPPMRGPKNDPMMPIAWTHPYTGSAGKAARTFTTTMGAATDLENEGLRRLLVNACYWAVGLEKHIPEHTDVRVVGEYHPSQYGFGGYVKGRRPSDYGAK